MSHFCLSDFLSPLCLCSPAHPFTLSYLLPNVHFLSSHLVHFFVVHLSFPLFLFLTSRTRVVCLTLPPLHHSLVHSCRTCQWIISHWPGQNLVWGSSKWLLTIGKQLLWSRNQGETDWQIDERQQGLSFSLFTDSLCLAFLIGQDVVAVFKRTVLSKETGQVWSDWMSLKNWLCWTLF